MGRTVLGPEPTRRIERRLVGCAAATVAKPYVADLRAERPPGVRPAVIVDFAAVLLTLERVHEARPRQELKRTAKSGDDIENLLNVVLHVQPRQCAKHVPF